MDIYTHLLNTLQLFNYYSINRGGDVFKNADKFDPEWFLKEDGSFDAALAKSSDLIWTRSEALCWRRAWSFSVVFVFCNSSTAVYTIEEPPAHPLDTA